MDPKTKALQKEWYGKLKESGFDDIEQEDGNLKVWASHLFSAHHNEILFKAKEDYYRLAGHFLNDHTFNSNLEKMVWELHATGLSIREIVTTLKQKKIKTYKDKIHKIIKNLTNEMMTKCR